MNEENLWQQVLDELKIVISKPIFQTLLSQTNLLSLENDVATIACPNPYLQSLIEGRYYSLLKSSLDRKTKRNNSLVFVIRPKMGEGPSLRKSQDDSRPLFEWQKEKKEQTEKVGLNPRYTFATFVVGNANNFAHAAAQAIIQSPGTTYNPFFVWGGVGVGKTHLIQAIGHAILTKYPNFKVLYCPSETFTNDLVQALQNKTITTFKKKYRDSDVLLVDDIQFIAGKEYTQEEFFHTFNALYLSGKQIVLTSDRRPEEIPKIEERLTSRFMGGLTVDIQPPDFEMRVAIIKAKCQEGGIDLEEQAVSFLAQMATSNIRELEGTLSQILTKRAVSDQAESDLEFVKKFLGVRNKTRAKILSPKQIIWVVAKHFNTKTADLIGQSRQAELVLSRQIAMYLLREEAEIPLVKIGEILGGRDHTTIIHGVRKIRRRFTSDLHLRHEIMLIKQALYQ